MPTHFLPAYANRSSWSRMPQGHRWNTKRTHTNKAKKDLYNVMCGYEEGGQKVANNCTWTEHSSWKLQCGVVWLICLWIHSVLTAAVSREHIEVSFQEKHTWYACVVGDFNLFEKCSQIGSFPQARVQMNNLCSTTTYRCTFMYIMYIYIWYIIYTIRGPSSFSLMLKTNSKALPSTAIDATSHQLATRHAKGVVEWPCKKRC